MQRPSKEEWKAWVRDPITQYFLSDVQAEREYVKEGWAQGKAGDQANVMMGLCQGMQRVLDYAVKYFEYAGKKEEEDAKSAGVSDSSETSRSGDDN